MNALLLFVASSPVYFMENGFAVQWYAVRSGIAGAGYERAIELAKTPDDRAARLAMANVDGLAAIARNADEFVTSLGRLPSRAEFDAAKERAVAVAGEIKKAPSLVDRFSKELSSARSTCEGHIARNAGMFAQIAKDLKINEPKASFLVLLVPDAPAPGAATFRSAEGGVCVIGVRSFKRDELFEAVLHEATHAMDDADRTGDNMLGRIRKSLAEHGIESTSPLMRDVPHAVIFAAADSRARQALGKDYVPFGVAHGAYTRMGIVAKVVLEVWTKYVTGAMSADAAVKEIVERCVKVTAV